MILEIRIPTTRTGIMREKNDLDQKRISSIYHNFIDSLFKNKVSGTIITSNNRKESQQ
jgi:hypothetical protein